MKDRLDILLDMLPESAKDIIIKAAVDNNDISNIETRPSTTFKTEAEIIREKREALDKLLKEEEKSLYK